MDKQDRRNILIYVAGALTPKSTDNHAIEYLRNARRLLQASLQVFSFGFTPYCPANDMLFFLAEGGGNITEAQIKDMSMEYLRRSDGVLMLAGWEKSVGCIAEAHEANKYKIPVYLSMKELYDAYS